MFVLENKENISVSLKSGALFNKFCLDDSEVYEEEIDYL